MMYSQSMKIFLFKMKHKVESENISLHLIERADGTTSLRYKHELVILPEGCPPKVYNEYTELPLKFNSVEALFEDLLCGGDKYDIADETRFRLAEFIHQLYVIDDKLGLTKIPLQERYTILQSYHKPLPYSTTTQKLQIGQPFIELRDELKDGNADNCKDVISNSDVTYTKLLSEAIKQEIIPSEPIVTSLCFPTWDNILIWSFERLVARNSRILRCKHCDAVFIWSSERRVYCSAECRTKHSILSRSLGNKEIQQVHASNTEALRRKTKSNHKYQYSDKSFMDEYKSFWSLSDQELKDEVLLKALYDPSWMLSNEGLGKKRQWNDRCDTLYQKEDFMLIAKGYRSYYNMHFDSVYKAYEKVQNKELTQEDYKKVVNDMVLRLKMVREQITAFVLEGNK